MSKKKDELPMTSFRISDVKRPEVRSFAKGSKAEAQAPSPSVGFPSVEERLERGSVDEVADELRPSYEKLDALAQSGDMKGKAAAKKAMGAYERTADLFEYLFATKAALQSK